MAAKDLLFGDPSALTNSLTKDRRLLGIDLGSKTIGLAISDPNFKIASPITTLKRGKLTVDAAAIEQIVTEREIGGLLVGLPINMDGTALYQAVAVLFIAQIYGVELALAEQLIIVLTATLASVGAAGVPSAGIITLIIVLNAVGMGEHVQAGIALILGVDRILDMIRTSVNVTGDLTCAAVIARSEGETLSLAGATAGN